MLTSLAMSNGVKQCIRRQVVGMLCDRVNGETPVQKSADALFATGSVAWRVHGDVASMMVGGISSLLMQMLHPSVLAGVWDHSSFRADMHGRLRRTARFIAVTTYADRELAQATMARVRRVHDQVSGTRPDGTAYHANDPALLAWVHVTETTSFLNAWIRYRDPAMSAADQDRYFLEMALIGRAMGASPVPRSRSQARTLIENMRTQLFVDERTETVARRIMQRGMTSLAAEGPRRLAVKAAVDLLPHWARTMHGLGLSPLEPLLVRAGTFGIAQALRWAFK